MTELDPTMRLAYAALCRQPGSTMADLAEAGLSSDDRVIGVALLRAGGLVRVDTTGPAGYRYWPTGERKPPTQPQEGAPHGPRNDHRNG